MRLKANLAADGALVLVTLIWGSTFVLAKQVLDYWPPLAYIGARFVLASITLAVIFPKQLASARAREWKMGATLGAIMVGGFTLQAVGQIYTTPSKSAFITGLTTPLVPFVALLVLRVRPSFENLAGVVLASLGGILILMPSEASVNRGDVITLSCTVLFAAHITLLSVYAKRVELRQLTALQISSAAILITIIWTLFRLFALVAPANSLPEAVAREAVQLPFSTAIVLQLVYLSLIGIVATFLLWTWGQGRMSATHAAIIFSLEPVFATLFAVAVRGRGEWMGRRGTLGAALIFIGIIISELRWSERRRMKGAREAIEDDDADISIDVPEDAATQ